MSSRAAGGRRRQLKPLQEQQQPKKASEPVASKPSKGFFSRSKSKAPLPLASAILDPAVAPQVTVAYPSPPPTTPTPLIVPSHTPNQSHEQEVTHLDQVPNAKPHTPSAILARSFAKQHFDKGANRTPAVQSVYPTFPESFMVSDRETSLEASYHPSPRVHPSYSRPLPPTASTMISNVSDPRTRLTHEDFRNPPPQFRSPPIVSTRRETRHQQQPRPLPIYSDSPPTSSDFPLPPTSSPPQDSLLLQPVRRASASPTPTACPSYRSSLSQTPLDRTDLQPESETRSRFPNSFLRPGHQPGYGDSTSDATSSAYSLPSSSNPSPTPSSLGWINSSSSLSDSDSRASYQSLHAFGSISPSPSPTNIQEVQRGVNAAESISTSSGSSHNSAASDPALSPKSLGFVFPGSRSTARPKVSAKTGTPQKIKIKIGGKKLDDHNLYPFTPITPHTLYTDSSMSPNKSPSFDHTESSTFNVSTSPQLRAGSTYTTSTTSTTPTSTQASSSPGTNASAQSFIYPASRSRAHPTRAPIIGKKKDVAAGSSDERRGKLKFMGIRLRLKRKKGSIGSREELEPVRSAAPIVNASSANGLAIEVGNENAGGSETRTLGGMGREEYGADEYPQSSPSPPSVPTGMAEPNKTRKGKGRGKYGSYPLDPYDSLLLDNDRHTGELLRRLNPTNTPTFHNYGNMPPTAILDLGCGQGHWVLDAAIAWKGYGTLVTGFDMVDTMKTLRPWAISQGVADNITFVRGNFLKERLPFPDESFDLVRMSCLTLCIPSDSWEFILEEVCRVLTLGGRLELIDDHIFFPYGKAPPLADASLPSFPDALSKGGADSVNSGLASMLSTFSINAGTTNPELGLALSEEELASGDLYDLYGLREEVEEDKTTGEDDQEENDEADTATLHGVSREIDTSVHRATPRPRGASLSTPQSLTASEWNQQQAVSKDLEALFEHLLTHEYGLHINPATFILEMLKKVFGHAREMATMHLMLAPPRTDNRLGKTGAPAPRTALADSFAESPGLVLWPSALIPMSPAEIEIHALKHLRTLLSCKNALAEHAVDATEDEEIDEESVLEALWEYESFFRHRFNPPPGADDETNETVALGGNTSPRRTNSHQSSGSISRMSVHSVTSVSTENQDAMWEYQMDVRQHFAWPLGTPDNPDTVARTPAMATSSARSSTPPPATRSNRDTIMSNATIAPPYSRIELAHLRTFRIYEAVKVDELTLGATYAPEP